MKKQFFILLAITPIATASLVLPTASLAPSEQPSKIHADASFFFPVPVSSSPKILEEPSSVEENKSCSLKPFDSLSSEEEKVLQQATEFIPCSLLASLQSIISFDDIDRPRAMASATRLYLRSDLFHLPERKEVIIHELGHVVDLGGLRGSSGSEISSFRDGTLPVFADDLSVRFYEISWKSEREQTSETLPEDFVTGYAATDPFEDFSESFLFYLEQGNAFRAYAKKNGAIRQKHNFFQKEIFDDVEFMTGGTPTDFSSREWDATKVDFS